MNGFKDGLISRKDILEELKPYLCCYICKEVPTKSNPHRFKSMNGSYVFCAQCKETCDFGSKIAKQPCGLTSKLLEFLPSFCCHSRNGCTVEFMQLWNFHAH